MCDVGGVIISIHCLQTNTHPIKIIKLNISWFWMKIHICFLSIQVGVPERWGSSKFPGISRHIRRLSKENHGKTEAGTRPCKPFVHGLSSVHKTFWASSYDFGTNCTCVNLLYKLAFALCLYSIDASSEGSGETSLRCMLLWAFTDHKPCRLTRAFMYPIFCLWDKSRHA